MGSRKGIPNKKTAEAEEVARRLKVDPFEVLLMFAKGDWKGLGYDSPTLTYFTQAGIEAEKDRITPETRVMAAKEAVKYLRSQRKAVELSGPGGGPVPLEYLVAGNHEGDLE